MALFDSAQGSTARPPARVLGAAWVAVGLHLAIAGILTSIASRSRVSDQQQGPDNRPRAELIWLAPGPGGGLDGGGNRSREQAPRVERRGTARTTIPAAVPPSLAGKENREPPAQTISIPAVPEASSLRDVPGVLTTLAVADGPARGPGDGSSAGDAVGPGLDRGKGGTIGGGPAGPGGGVTPPELIRQVKPAYTSSALQARLTGLVTMEAVVLPDGSVGDVKIIRSLDAMFGLDQEAIKAVKQWRFRPAMRRGDAVPMLVSIEMIFELR